MLIIPDVHGRSFWKTAVEGNEWDTIVFLGDYFDPYGYEEEFRGLDNTNAFNKLEENFKAILELKKSNPDNVILLLGNHDLHYTHIDKCSRYNYLRAGEIWKLFTDNRELFQMAYEKITGDKRFIFSHAGLSRDWLKSHTLLLRGWNDENVVDYVNNAYLTKDGAFFNCLNDVSCYRGGYDACGSMVWADFREYIKNENFSEEESSDNGLIGDFQIFGHTQLEEKPVVWDNFANLDCRQAFILTENGILTTLEGAPLEKTKF